MFITTFNQPWSYCHGWFQIDTWWGNEDVLMLDRFILYYVLIVVIIAVAEIKQRLKRDSVGRSMLFRHSHDLHLKELDDPEMPADDEPTRDLEKYDELTGPKSNPDTRMLANKRRIRVIQWKLLYAGFGLFIAGFVVAYFLAVVVCQTKQRFRLPSRNKQHNEESECNIITCFHTMYKVLCRLIYPGLCIHTNVFNHYHRIKMLWQLTKLSAFLQPSSAL